MPRGLVRGYPPQKLCALLQRELGGRAAIVVGDMINTGIDGGSEFGFLVYAKDGAEMLVSVMQRKAPTLATKGSLANVLAEVDRKQQRYLVVSERRRKRFLGIS